MLPWEDKQPRSHTPMWVTPGAASSTDQHLDGAQLGHYGGAAAGVSYVQGVSGGGLSTSVLGQSPSPWEGDSRMAFHQETAMQESQFEPWAAKSAAAKRRARCRPKFCKMLVPDTLAGAIIGKDGVIGEVEHMSKCQLQLSAPGEYFPGTTDRICLMGGSLKSLVDCIQRVLERLRTSDLCLAVKLVVPNTATSLVELSGATGCQIVTSRGLEESVVLISGPYQLLVDATLLITRSIQVDPRVRQNLQISYESERVPSSCADPSVALIDPHCTDRCDPGCIDRYSQRELVEYLLKAAPPEVLLRYGISNDIESTLQSKAGGLVAAVAEIWEARTPWAMPLPPGLQPMESQASQMPALSPSPPLTVPGLLPLMPAPEAPAPEPLVASPEPPPPAAWPAAVESPAGRRWRPKSTVAEGAGVMEEAAAVAEGATEAVLVRSPPGQALSSTDAMPLREAPKDTTLLKEARKRDDSKCAIDSGLFPAPGEDIPSVWPMLECIFFALGLLEPQQHLSQGAAAKHRRRECCKASVWSAAPN